MIWTATKIDKATFCIRNLWYLSIRKPRYVPPVKGLQAKGIFLHKFKQGFYKKNKNGILVPKFKSAETFTNTAINRWNYIVSRGTIQKKPIIWRDKKEPWIIREEIKKICKHLYERYSQEEPPLFTESPFDFCFDGRRYRGRIDEIRKNMKLRDIKFSRRTPEEVNLLVDPQFTLYSLAFMVMCYENREFAEICNVPRGEVKKWMGNPSILSEKIDLEYYLVRDKGIEIFPATRNNNHYYDFCNMLEGLEEQIKGEQWRYVKRGGNCAYCDSNKPCVKKAGLKNSTISPKKGRQGHLFLDAPKIKEKIKYKQLKLKFSR